MKKKMGWKWRVSLISVFASVIIPVHAAPPQPCGLYIDANAGLPTFQNNNYPGDISYPNSRSGWNVNLGYRFIPYIAAEMGYTGYYGTRSYDLAINDPTTGNQAGLVKHYAVDFAGKFILPLGQSGGEVFVKLGASAVNANTTVTDGTAAANIDLNDNNKTAVGPYVGVGANYFVIPGWAITAQWARAQGNDRTSNGTLWSAGLLFAIT